MQDSLQKIINLLHVIEETLTDEEFSDCINESILQLEAAQERLVEMNEEFDAEAQSLSEEFDAEAQSLSNSDQP
jgi:hypothetical protein